MKRRQFLTVVPFTVGASVAPFTVSAGSSPDGYSDKYWEAQTTIDKLSEQVTSFETLSKDGTQYDPFKEQPVGQYTLDINGTDFTPVSGTTLWSNSLKL
jgi:hypothetical protein